MENGQLTSGWWALLLVVSLALAVGRPITALIHSATGARKAFRHWRRSHGHYTKTEAVAVSRQVSSAQAWRHAQALQHKIEHREIPEPIQIWDVVARANEVFFMDVPADYARYCGRDVGYSQTSAFYYGRPSFVLAGVGATALSNAARRNAAARLSAAQWREQQPCRLVVSNQRLLCQVGGRWLSFHFAGMTAVYPEIENWALVTQYDSTSPMMISGVNVPAAALFTVLATHGAEAATAHPSLQKLRAGTVANPA